MDWKGVLIWESLQKGTEMWEDIRVIRRRRRRLEHEYDRGYMTFLDVEVADRDIRTLMHRAAGALRSPGCTFMLREAVGLW